MATFVLVHGAWCGGWVWHDTARALQTSGHEVFTPTLTGCGERVHLLSRSVGLATHIADVTHLLDYEELQDVILVGHSYAGVVITGVIERVRDRVSRLVYLDAFTPCGGAPLLEQVTWSELARQSAVMSNGVPVVPPPPAPMLGLSAKGEAMKRLTPFPLAAFEQRTPTGSDDLAAIGAYVRCAENLDPTLTGVALRAQEAGWTYREVTAPHSAMLTHPDALAATLLELASPIASSVTDGQAA